MSVRFHTILSRSLIPLLLMVWVTAGCSILPAAPTKDTSALSLIPSVPGYNSTNTTDVKNTLATMLGGGALLAGQPEVTAMVAAASRLATCYNNAGAFEAYVFTKQSDLSQAGVILVINDNVLGNVQVLLSCLNPANIGSSVQDVQPCSKHYTLSTANNSYEIMYVATAPQVCNDFCNALQGCLAH